MAKAFIVIYNSKAGEGEGVGVYMHCRAEIVQELEEVQHALNLLGKRRGRPYQHIEKFMDKGPQRVYKAQAQQVWTNDATKDADGDFIRDFRKKISLL